MADTETLLSPSNVFLYGRVLTDLQFNFQAPPANNPAAASDAALPRLGDNNFLQKQLAAHSGDAQKLPRLARIYGFSYEGHYYDLPKPVLFLVHGPGADPEGPRPGQARVSRAPADADRTGVAAATGSFSEDMKVWSYDKGDFSIRLDVETGPFEQILLESLLRPDAPRSYYSGADLRISGADMRVSGADLRVRRNRGGGVGD